VRGATHFRQFAKYARADVEHKRDARGRAEASKEAISCAAPSSNKLKLSAVSPRTCVPSGAVTVQATCTRVTRERMAPSPQWLLQWRKNLSRGMQFAGNRFSFQRNTVANG